MRHRMDDKKVAWRNTKIQKKDTIISRKNQHPINLSLGDISNRIRYTVEALRGLGKLIVKRLYVSILINTYLKQPDIERQIM